MINVLSWSSNNEKSIGEMLVDSGKITKKQLEEVLNMQRQQDKRLEEILTELNYVSENELIDFLSEKLYICKVDLSEIIIEGEVARSIPKEIAEKYKAIPFREENGSILVAMSDPTNLIAIDDIRFITQKNVQTYIAKHRDIDKAINTYYGEQARYNALEELKEEFRLDVDENFNKEMMDDVENAPTVRLTNSILTQAIDMKASDIHIEPFENTVYVRYRVDGTLNDNMTIPKNLYSAVSTRLKIIAGMDIAEKRIPQDGRIELKFNSKPYDFRVSSLPTVFGEKIVMRILDRTGSIMTRGKLGFTDEENKMLDKILRKPNGIILVTGPTGSGKTTTLYSFLDEMNTSDINITTIEDPVEYMLPRINQVQVNSKAGMTFAAGLRSMLRQDPDVIMIGEIRDEETADIAVRASITGHLVISTLHTNDAPSSITRLLDMGIEPYLAADAVVAIIAQRLIRRLCPKCKELALTAEWENELLGFKESQTVYKAKGCNECSNTGYKGRIAVHEVLLMNNEIKKVIERSEGMEKIKQASIKSGMTTLYENCKEIILKGETTVSEMVKTIHGGE